eukprot:5653476-Amphidinium_carterae.1
MSMGLGGTCDVHLFCFATCATTAARTQLSYMLIATDGRWRSNTAALKLRTSAAALRSAAFSFR